jgi:hypothetical protein
MGFIPERLVKEGFGTLVGELLQRKPVTDPHLLFMALGDAVVGDQQPLQATQFEADNSILAQITDLYLEGGGGGNCFESYDLAWAFAAYRTRTDAWETRKSRGFLFTVGDECYPEGTATDYLRKVFGSDCPQAPTPDALLAAAQERYAVFHVIIAEGSFCRGGTARASSTWKQRLNKRAVILDDHRYLPELLVSMIAIEAGQEVDDALGWWEQAAAGSVKKALVS